MRQDTSRWVEVTRSQFTHEAEGLAIIRDLLPPVSPYRAWSNFEFRDNHGKWHEVDLLVLGRRRLHLVELKYYSGTLRGDDLRWVRDGRRAEDSPLKLARRKAQRLATRLRDELVAWARERGTRIPDPYDVIPFVKECVFLHHPDLRCELPATARIDVFGLDGAEDRTNLPGISTRLLEPPSARESVPSRRDETIAALLARIGLVQRRQREIGSWVIDDEPLAEGDGWQDWPAFHRVATTDRARIRFYVTPPGTPASERVRLRRLAEHEYRIMSRLASDNLLKPRDIVEDELGTGLVYPHDERFQRLDLWLAEHPQGIPATTQLAILRQVAEAVAYAHRHRVVHRGLTPAAIRVRSRPDREPAVLVGDWQTAGISGDPTTTGLAGVGITSLPGSNGSGSRLVALLQPGVDLDRQFAEVFQAPEGVWNRDADRVRLDVFSLGALAYYLVAGRAPAPDRATLRERLHRDRGLDLAADLPQVSPALRRLVLEATRPAVSERLRDVTQFLAGLAKAEQELATPEELLTVDPLEAVRDTVLDGRFRLEQRLGAGSTAVGLLVQDLQAGGELRVLKVAIDDAAAQRLEAEADVLRQLNHPRLVRLIEGPIEVGNRRALLLERAGTETLAEVLRDRGRLSLDLLERWGTDLLEALVALDRARVDHRDIKPANLGVRESKSDRAKHLVLFDFSLARAGATSLTAGTPPYLDPFLEDRGRYDSAAERYAAAVVLFEMATGRTPVYGDGQTDPKVIDDEVTLSPQMFDPSVADACVSFFRVALARDASARYDTAADMLAAWKAIFAPVPKTAPDDAEQRAARAKADTPLTESGLSARALSALEPYGVTTVGDLAAIDPVRLNRLAGVAEATRREVKARARMWREKLAAELPPPRPAPAAGYLPSPIAAADLLLARAGSARSSRRRVAALMLGLDGEVDPFATQAEIGRALGVTRARAGQLMSALQEAWAADDDTRGLLDAIAVLARDAIARLGGVATVDELSDDIQTHLPPADDKARGDRLVAGLLRVALDRVDALARAEGLDAATPPLAHRRRGGRMALIATDPLLLDAGEAVARHAEALVAEAGAAGHAVVARQRAATALLRAAARIVPGASGLTGERLVRLAGRLSNRVAASGHGELHDRGLPAAAALGLTLSGLGARQQLTPQEVRDRVRARFPALAPLPDRPRLDEVIAEAGLPLVYDEAARAYRSREAPSDMTSLATSPPSQVTLPAEETVTTGATDRRLRESLRTRSFLALGVEAIRVDRAVDVLVRRYGATVVDVTRVLVEALRRRADHAGVPWDLVRAADAAAPGTRDAMGLAALVEQSLPAVTEAVEAAAREPAEGARPVVLTELAPLARYGHLGILSQWTDLAAPRRQAIWVMVPQLLGNQGSVIDGRPLPLAAPGQFLRVEAEWLAAAPVPA
ncbi:MAG UNVERIFIED_CONTAM: BREX system serine/threonine kinase PglW [Thermobifida fusca]